MAVDSPSPMELALTWDLFVIVFFAIITAYSFIVGKHESIKIIIAIYIAVLTVQGIGNILLRLTSNSSPLFEGIGITVDPSLLATIKLLLFIVAIIFLVVRGGFEIRYTRETGNVLNTVLTGFFGFATAGLLLSTLITFIAGAPLLSSTLSTTPSLSPLIGQSKLLEVMVLNQDLWFSLPALFLVAAGFIGELEEEEE